MSQNSKCGFCGINPKWLQNFATTRTFIVVYGFLGTVQGIFYVYMTVSLTTLEKRFKISSQTTGIILSGNEISQVLSILLIYYGGSAHRPRWIAIGVALSAISCVILALPHFIYGPGQDALALTHEYLNATALKVDVSKKKEMPICFKNEQVDRCKKEDVTDTNIVSNLLVFFSQFVLGIGATMYWGLGQPYLDDNLKKKNIPMVFALTFALRTLGPLLGFVFFYFCMNLYMDPSLHPAIDRDDPRWLEAWWFGWITLALMQGIFALLLAFFPAELRKSKPKNKKAPLNQENEEPLKNEVAKQRDQLEESTLKEFPAAIKRLVTNKLLMINTFSAVFYVLGYSSFMSFFAKYMEVQFSTSSADSSIISGPFSIMGCVLGLLISGYAASKFKLSARFLVAWGILVGLSYVIGQIIFTFISCEKNGIHGVDSGCHEVRLNLTNPCNEACDCEHVNFAPVCHEATATTFFSACHAGCQTIVNDTVFSDCSCVSKLAENTNHQSSFLKSGNGNIFRDYVVTGPCKTNCFKPYMIFSIASLIINFLFASGGMGNVLVNYRCVETRDKSLAQGIGLVAISLISYIPGPIIYGAIIDSTCLVWDFTCENIGNCWIYDKDKFRYYIHAANAGFTMIGMFFDMLVWYYSKDLNLYGEEEELTETRSSELQNIEKIRNHEDFDNN